ncbi:MAG: magnesium citrate secondary transporter [Bacteroidota bacterium]|nr:magnesium citrate secondary transporter [Bacteroidota bacterium]
MEKQFGIFIPFIHAYLDDFLCMPVVLTLTLYILQMILKEERFRLSKYQVIFAIIYFSVMFELVLPAFSSKYTSDVMDIAAYLIGAFVFYKYINRPSLKLQTQ